MPTTTAKTRVPKELRDLQRRLKPGWTLVKARSGHWNMQNEDGEFLTIEGKKWITSGTWGEAGFDKKMLYGPLRAAGVLLNQKGDEYVDPEVASARRRAAADQITASRRLGREAAATALRERLSEAIGPIGALDREGMNADLCQIAALLSRDADRPLTPDLLSASIHRVIHGGWITPPYQEAWARLCEALETSSNRVETFFALVRRARGLPETVVLNEPGTLVAPQGKDGAWAFEVIEIPIDKFMVDHTYQRPVPWPFIRKTAASFDESLVGTIDVSARGHGVVYAILDGQCRFEACRLVGKKSIWASVYNGLTLEEEARFFLHKNQDRKAIHPYYLYKARLTAGDAETVAVTKLVEQHGYRVWMSTTQAETDGSIASIAALHALYGRAVNGYGNLLEPVLDALDATRGRPHGQSQYMLMGLGEFFGQYHDLDRDTLREVLALQGPDWIIGRSREIKRDSSLPMSKATARAIAMEYNRLAPARGAKKLNVWGR